MTWLEVLGGQFADPFRWGLIVALVATQARTAAVTGRWVPLAAGVLFVAVILPTTTGTGAAEPLWLRIAVGCAANVVMLAVVLALRAAVLRLR